MYWDDLVLAGKQPTEATLLAADYSSDLAKMIDEMNRLPAPQLPDGTLSAPYRFMLAGHREKQLA